MQQHNGSLCTLRQLLEFSCSAGFSAQQHACVRNIQPCMPAPPLLMLARRVLSDVDRIAGRHRCSTIEADLHRGSRIICGRRHRPERLWRGVSSTVMLHAPLQPRAERCAPAARWRTCHVPFMYLVCRILDGRQSQIFSRTGIAGNFSAAQLDQIDACMPGKLQYCDADASVHKVEAVPWQQPHAATRHQPQQRSHQHSSRAGRRLTAADAPAPEEPHFQLEHVAEQAASPGGGLLSCRTVAN